jgi:hypothetical protein
MGTTAGIGSARAHPTPKGCTPNPHRYRSNASRAFTRFTRLTRAFTRTCSGTVDRSFTHSNIATAHRRRTLPGSPLDGIGAKHPAPDTELGNIH